MVKTGIYKGGESNKADYIVDNFYEGIKLVCEIENIKNIHWDLYFKLFIN